MTGNRKSTRPPAIGGGRVLPSRFTLSNHDRQWLMERRFQDDVVRKAQLGSIRVDEDLKELGLDWDIDELSSLLVIPYLQTRDTNGRCLIRIHERTLPGIVYPPYFPPVLNPSGLVVICGTELQALAATQLGARAIGLQGPDSFIDRLDELAEAVKFRGANTAYICLDREWDADEVLHDDRSTRAALTYALGLERHGVTGLVADLPERYHYDEGVDA